MSGSKIRVQFTSMIKKLTQLFFLLGMLAILLVAAANLTILAAADAYILEEGVDAPRASAVIILGARVYPSGRLSPMLEDRVRTGQALYEAGYAPKILLSGDHGQENYDEVNAMRRYLLGHDIPPEDIFLDHAGFSTYESMFRAEYVFLVEDALIVTQAFHLARAVYTARTLGIDAVGVVADRRDYSTRDLTRLQLREILARTKAFLDLHFLKPDPTFLGDPIPISGDGRQTWDEP